MSELSILLNIITMAIVGYMFYAAFRIYNNRPDKNMTASEVFQNALKDPGFVTHAYFQEAKTGPVGEFEGHTDLVDNF
tara:strand:+ start:16053 stop:16286 length:234 start_codon:yes stop_codon:yes gene_type:complete